MTHWSMSMLGEEKEKTENVGNIFRQGSGGCLIFY